ncbi:MAG: hypothetical protein AVDCRST_MAG27-1283 [uncultured Craurococcus sp.]|uniref:Uncharacterized protein n=1 Tax=uncultured Craurococcus sp. TaxID=1135998 RepID=A0A6J4I063_9PROT|nr:MAG: hypothetical protein AVDCRST_MAG27-1283 [uncultured Craurococcus sp.]
MPIPIGGAKASAASTITGGIGNRNCGAVGVAARAAAALVVCEAMFPELPLLDVNLRGGASGADVARALLERWGVP